MRAISLETVDFFTSHEALHLPFEEALTRRDPNTGRWYGDLGPHAVDRRAYTPAGWRSCGICARCFNPIGMKCGPTMEPDDLFPVLDKLEPRQ